MAEIHTLGSMPILEAVLRAVLAGGARLAEPGEFTLRAFLSGRIDLTQAEAVLGVIEAELPEELDAALAQMAGGLAAPLGQLRDALLELLSQVEAGLDFADEDLAFISPEQLAGQLDAAAAQVARLSERIVLRGDAMELVRVVLVGLPNTGKSSLFNALARGAEALVSHEPGTTRDYLTAELDLDGVKCQLIDTAGVDEEKGRSAGILPAPGFHGSKTAVPGPSEPGPAAAAQAVALQQAHRAHVQVLCIDASQILPSPSERGAGGEGEGSTTLASTVRRLVVLTKADLLGTRSSAGPGRLASNTTEQLPQAIETSSVTGQGLGQLRQRLREAVLHAIGPRGDVVAGTAVRAGESVRRAAECLDRAREIARTGRDEELLAAELRTALDELGKVAGAVYTEDLLDHIFSRFCIGK
jgi:tRNA modification GTPase